MAYIRNPKASRGMILDKLADYPNGLTAKELTEIMGVNVVGRMSKLFDVGDVERTPEPVRYLVKHEYRYKTKLPKITAPPSADVESPCVASQTAGVE